MPRCRSCEGYVTNNYVQVFAAFGDEFVSVCPRCESGADPDSEVVPTPGSIPTSNRTRPDNGSNAGESQ